MNTCDMCDKEYSDRIFVVRRRPSDPTELVAVMWICTECCKRPVNSGKELDERLVQGDGIPCTGKALDELTDLIGEGQAQSKLWFVSI